MVTTAINTRYFNGMENGVAYGTYASALGVPPNTDYTRYWHGSMTFIRPLLAITDIDGVKAFSAVIMVLLLGLNCFMLIRRKNIAAAIIFILSLILVQAFYVPFSIEYIIAFMVMLFLLPLYIRFAENDTALLYFSVFGGTLIAFTDFLTVETITLLVPLLIVFFIRVKNGRLSSFKDGFILTVQSGIGWLLAYIFTFVSKWGLATLVTGEDKFTAALTSLTERANGVAADFDSPFEQAVSALFSNLTMLFPVSEKELPLASFLAVIIYIAVPLVIAFIFRQKDKSGIIFLFVLIGIIPLVRFIMLSNHSYLHNFFTYRALIVTIMAMFGAMCYTIDKSKLPFFKQSVPAKKKGGRK